MFFPKSRLIQHLQSKNAMFELKLIESLMSVEKVELISGDMDEETYLFKYKDVNIKIEFTRFGVEVVLDSLNIHELDESTRFYDFVNNSPFRIADEVINKIESIIKDDTYLREQSNKYVSNINEHFTMKYDLAEHYATQFLIHAKKYGFFLKNDVHGSPVELNDLHDNLGLQIYFRPYGIQVKFQRPGFDHRYTHLNLHIDYDMDEVVFLKCLMKAFEFYVTDADECIENCFGNSFVDHL